MKRGEPHPSLYEGVLGSPHSPFVLHASKEPVLVGTGWPTFLTLEHSGKKPHKRLLIALCLPKPSGDGVNGVAK